MFLEVKFSIYMNRRVFVMIYPLQSLFYALTQRIQHASPFENLFRCFLYLDNHKCTRAHYT